jgi:hypothetical protein
MHPLAPDLTKLTDDELNKNFNNLQSKLMFAYRAGQSDMVGQLNLLLDDYRIELETRNRKLLEAGDKSGKSFADKIDITK